MSKTKSELVKQILEKNFSTVTADINPGSEDFSVLRVSLSAEQGGFSANFSIKEDEIRFGALNNLEHNPSSLVIFFRNFDELCRTLAIKKVHFSAQGNGAFLWMRLGGLPDSEQWDEMKHDMGHYLQSKDGISSYSLQEFQATLRAQELLGKNSPYTENRFNHEKQELISALQSDTPERLKEILNSGNLLAKTCLTKLIWIGSLEVPDSGFCTRLHQPLHGQRSGR